MDTTATSGECTVLSEGMDVNLSEGWYVLREDVTFSDRLMVDSGTVNLILCDGATLTDNAGIGVGANATLNIYGQSEDSGKIAVTMAEADSSYAAIGGTDKTAGDINIHGGTMELTNNTSAVSGAGIGGCASCSVQSVSIYGGNVKTTNQTYLTADMEIGWTELSDSLSFNGFNIIGNRVIKVTDGQAFIDEDGNIYSGTLNSDQITSMTGKTLTPYLGLHHYGDPKWSWAEDYSSASATFTCTDSRCKHEETLDGAIEKTDVREKTTYTASVTLDDRTYTDEKIVEKGLYNITVADTVNGTVTAGLDTAYEGEEITLAVTPDERYVLYSLTVTDAEGNEVEVTEDDTFIMPASDVTVTAKFAYTYIIGDVDGDGDVTIIDATLILRYDVYPL